MVVVGMIYIYIYIARTTRLLYMGSHRKLTLEFSSWFSLVYQNSKDDKDTSNQTIDTPHGVQNHGLWVLDVVPDGWHLIWLPCVLFGWDPGLVFHLGFAFPTLIHICVCVCANVQIRRTRVSLDLRPSLSIYSSTIYKITVSFPLT
jgi:hypothetical protein